MYQLFQGDVITWEQMLASKSTQRSYMYVKSLSQSAIVIAMCPRPFWSGKPETIKNVHYVYAQGNV